MKYLSFLLPLVFFACSKENISTPISPVGGIDLEEITPGSESNYILYESSCDGGFRFTGDTLNVKVVEENDTLYLEENYTAGSEFSFTGKHAIIPKDGYVLVPERFNSQMLFFYGNDTIFLEKDPEIELIQNGCRLRYEEADFVGEEIGNVENFEVGSVQIFDRKAISCVPTFFEIDAYIFYAGHLSAVHVIRKEESDLVTGFIAID